jgi:hypothetical protein
LGYGRRWGMIMNSTAERKSWAECPPSLWSKSMNPVMPYSARIKMFLPRMRNSVISKPAPTLPQPRRRRLPRSSCPPRRQKQAATGES